MINMSYAYWTRWLVTVILCMVTALASAQKPKWVGNTPRELNHTYKFVEVVSTGTSIESARMDSKDRLTDDTQLQDGVRIYRKTHQLTRIEKERSMISGFKETIRDHIDIDLTVDGEKFYLQAVRVDEYAEYQKGRVTLYTLYMVALCENPVFDRTYLTTSYGVASVFMSFIPGLGQWYKGSKVKGVSLFVAEAAAVAGVILCENERSTYLKKMKEQPKFAKEYNSKADNWRNGRNICIGVASGIWIYNIIDAAVAKGARRVSVNRTYGSGLSFVPFATPEVTGVSFTYRF